MDPENHQLFGKTQLPKPIFCTVDLIILEVSRFATINPHLDLFSTPAQGMQCEGTSQDVSRCLNWFFSRCYLGPWHNL